MDDKIHPLNYTRQTLLDQGQNRVFTPFEFLKIAEDNKPHIYYHIRFHWQSFMSMGFETIINLGCGDNAVGFKDPCVNFDVPEIGRKYRHDNFAGGNIYDMKIFRDKTFQCSVIGDVLEHLLHPERALSEARRITSKRLVVTIPSPEHDSILALPGHRNASEYRLRCALKTKLDDDTVDRLSYEEILDRIAKELPEGSLLIDKTHDHIQRFDAERVKRLFPQAQIIHIKALYWIGFLICEDYAEERGKE